ncbi:hypothetical protein L345_04013, partial [Ophiophagus hannah]
MPFGLTRASSDEQKYVCGCNLQDYHQVFTKDYFSVREHTHTHSINAIAGFGCKERRENFGQVISSFLALTYTQSKHTTPRVHPEVALWPSALPLWVAVVSRAGEARRSAGPHGLACCKLDSFVSWNSIKFLRNCVIICGMEFENSECKFTCTSGKCLYRASLLCNEQNDCGDNSDEENCLLVTEHPPPSIFS